MRTGVDPDAMVDTSRAHRLWWLVARRAPESADPEPRLGDGAKVAVMRRRAIRSPGTRSWLGLPTVAQNGVDGQVTVPSSVIHGLGVSMVVGAGR